MIKRENVRQGGYHVESKWKMCYIEKEKGKTRNFNLRHMSKKTISSEEIIII